MLRLWNRFIDMGDDRLTKKIFLWDYTQLNNNWSSEIKEICKILGNENVHTDLVKYDIDSIDSKCFELQEQRWKEDVSNKPKLRSYAKFKSNVCAENYVTSNLSRQRRSFLAQLRSGILPLRIETGRFCNPKLNLEDRICELCTYNVIEDEQHFLCECPSYDHSRRTLYEKAVSLDSNFLSLLIHDKFVFLMKKLLREVSLFIVQSYFIRQEKLHK